MAHGRYKENGKERERTSVDTLDEEVSNHEDTEVCVTEWVDMPKGKPVTCSFLKLSLGKMEEMKFTFDVTKCDKLFDVLLHNNIIRLKGGHVIPTVEQFARKMYYKWHDSYSHMTNDCNYFHRQIQLALNDSRLTFGGNRQMKLDANPFLVDLINFEEKKILVRPSQANITKGKNVIVSDKPRAKMIKPSQLEIGMWKANK
jgi:hypothetical protein